VPRADLETEVERLRALVEQLSAPSVDNQEVEVLGALETGIPFDERLPPEYHPAAAQRLAQKIEEWLEEQTLQEGARLIEMDCDSAPCLLAIESVAHWSEDNVYEGHPDFDARLADLIEAEGYPRNLLNLHMTSDKTSILAGSLVPDGFANEHPDAAELFEVSSQHRSRMIQRRVIMMNESGELEAE